MILFSVHGDWGEFIYDWEDTEWQFEEDMNGSRQDHQLEFMGRLPQAVFPIRQEDIRHMNWSLGEENPPYDE